MTLRDEFTAVRVSPQKRYGLRLDRDGKCADGCGRNRVNATHCAQCNRSRLAALRKRRAKARKAAE